MKDRHSKPNAQLFPKEVFIQLPLLKTAVTSIFTYFLLKPANAAMHGPHSLVRFGPGCAGRA